VYPVLYPPAAKISRHGRLGTTGPRRTRLRRGGARKGMAGRGRRGGPWQGQREAWRREDLAGRAWQAGQTAQNGPDLGRGG
jgi:hypothetical protein